MDYLPIISIIIAVAALIIAFLAYKRQKSQEEKAGLQSQYIALQDLLAERKKNATYTQYRSEQREKADAEVRELTERFNQVRNQLLDRKN